MIIETIIRTCPKCGSENIVRNGRDYKGAQKYHCHDCGSYGTLDKKNDTTRKPSSRQKPVILSEPACVA
jgi:transposase-like protein